MFPLEIEQKYTYNQRKCYLRTYKIASSITELAIIVYVESRWLFEVRFYTFPVDEGFFGAERNFAVNAVIT